ncbi:MAG: 3'-5' exonuclease [bacterium]
MYLFFDTETTGIPINYRAPITDLNNWPRLVQIAWIRYDENENKISQDGYIIKPEGFEIPEDASRVHGITTEEALANGKNLKRILNKFSNDIGESKVIVAHNMNFDEKIVGAEFLRKKISHNLFDIIRFCTMKEATNFCRLPGNNGGYKWPRLSELHIKLFGKDFEDAHDASSDVEACARCFFEMKKKGII